MSYEDLVIYWSGKGALEALAALERDVEPDGGTEHAAMIQVVRGALVASGRALADVEQAAGLARSLIRHCQGLKNLLQLGHRRSASLFNLQTAVIEAAQLVGKVQP